MAGCVCVRLGSSCRIAPFLLLLLLLQPLAARAQEPLPPPEAAPQPYEQPPVAPPPVYGQPQPAYGLAPAPAQALRDWRNGRALYGVGIAADLLGSGLALSGIFVAALYDSNRGTNIGSTLVLTGAGAHTLGFVLSAAGLGLQHNALEALGSPVNRGAFGVGTVFGALGLLGAGAGLFFAATSGYVPNQPTAALGCSVAGAALYLVSGIFYYVDAGRMNRAMRRLGRF